MFAEVKHCLTLDLPTFSFWVADYYFLPYSTDVNLCWLILQQLTPWEIARVKEEVINANAKPLSHRPAHLGLAEHTTQPSHTGIMFGTCHYQWTCQLCRQEVAKKQTLQMCSTSHLGTSLNTSDQWRRLGSSTLHLSVAALGTTMEQKDTMLRDDTGLYSVFQGCWRPQACSVFGSPPPCLPPVVAPAHFIHTIDHCCNYNSISPEQCTHLT